MTRSSCLSLLSVGAFLFACGGSNEPAKEPASIATPVPGGKTWAPTESTPPPSNNVSTTSAPAAPAVAPQAPAPQPVAAGNCDSCKGLISSELQSALTRRAEQEARKCYERVLTNNPAARASLSIEVRVGRDGSSCDTVAQADAPEWPGLTDCVATEFRRGGFPSPGNNSCVIAKVPILFTPKVKAAH